jgi:Uri superfamily endonuclease
MRETPRIAVYEQPTLDELVAVWLARRFFAAGKPVEVVFLTRSRPVYSEEISWWIEPSPVPSLGINWGREHRSFQEHYASSATGRLWAYLLELGRPVNHLVDLIDAVHADALFGGVPTLDAVWAGVGRKVRAAWRTAQAQTADGPALCQALHGWLDRYEAGLGIGRVTPVDLERALSRLPEEEGTYAMVLEAVAPGPVLLGRTGTLGRMEVRPGYYVYAGSAFQSGGVRGRWRHHLTPAVELALKWQVDCLRLRCAVVEGWFTTAPLPSGRDRVLARSARECALAMSVLAMRAATVPVRGFGSPEDRRCPAYLAYFEAKPSFRAFQSAVARSDWPCRLQRVVLA